MHKLILKAIEGMISETKAYYFYSILIEKRILYFLLLEKCHLCVSVGSVYGLCRIFFRVIFIHKHVIRNLISREHFSRNCSVDKNTEIVSPRFGIITEGKKLLHAINWTICLEKV